MNFSVDNLKRNVKTLLCLFFGAFHFVFMAMPYVSAYAKMDGETQIGFKYNGYKAMSFERMEGIDLGGFLAFLQIVILIVAIIVLLIGIYSFLKEFCGTELPSQWGNIDVNKVVNIAIRVFNVLMVVLFVFYIIMWIANYESEEYFGYEISGGVRPAWGVVVYTILSIASFVSLIVLPKKVPGFGDTSASVAGSSYYVCSNCGSHCKASSKFCDKCGGQVVLAKAYVCGNCGNTLPSAQSFCNKCGGRAVEVNAKPTYVCANCGTESKAKSGFCTVCGGKIIRK